MRCIDCNKAVFRDLNLVCKETGEVLVCKNEPMELLRDKRCFIITASSGKVGGSYFINGKLYCPYSKEECKEAGECERWCK